MDVNVRDVIRRESEARQVGQIYDLVPRKHEFSDEVLELKSFLSDLLMLKTLDSCALRDNLISKIEHRLNCGTNLEKTIEVLTRDLSSSQHANKTYQENYQRKIVELSRVKSDLDTNSRRLDAILDHLEEVKLFAEWCFKSYCKVAEPSFLNFGKKDLCELNQMRETFEKLFVDPSRA